MAYSIRSVVVPGLLAFALLAGCQRTGVSPVGKTNPTPIATDEAMALRDWSQEQALYSNGAAPAWPTLFPYEPDWKNCEYENALLDPTLLVGQTLALPVTAIVTPPWMPVIYHGVYVGPTYTADVPLEPIY